MTTIEQGTTKTRLIPLTAWNKYHTWPPIGGLRHLVFHSKVNGFDAVIKRVSGRVLVDEAAFFLWVEKNDAEAKGGNNG